MSYSISSSQDRKDSVIAEVKWFYRVSELPESVYHLLMLDREKGIYMYMYMYYTYYTCHLLLDREKTIIA